MARKKGTQAEATAETVSTELPQATETVSPEALTVTDSTPIADAQATVQEGATRVLTRYAEHQAALRAVYAERAQSEGGPTGIACPNCERKKAENRGEGEVGELVADGAVLPNRYPPERHVTCSYCGARDTVVV